MKFALRLTLLAIMLATSAAPIAAETKQDQAKAARQEALAKERRIIFNDDAGELEHEGSDTVDGFLEPRLRALAGTQVDTICWSILSEWGDAPSYDSKVQPIFGEAQGTPPTAGTGLFDKNLKALIDAGHCPLNIVIDFAHSHGMEAFASVRMNDCHDSVIEPSLRTLWKQQHPELLVKTEGTLPNKKLYITAQDYTHDEVRQRKLDVFEEVCQRYDIDGFELDYIRHPVFFSETMQGQPVTEKQVQIMTSFMRRVRQLTDQSGVARGRPILIAASVPDNLQLAMNVGLDVKRWLDEDLVDILIMGRGYAAFTMSIADVAELAHQYSVPVFPCINRVPSGYAEMSEEAHLGHRGLASNWYQQGADGIYYWNLGVGVTWPPKTGQDLVDTRGRLYAPLNEVGSPETLTGKNKLYAVDGPVFHYYAHVSSQPPLPIELRQDQIQTVPLFVGDDLVDADRDDTLDKLQLKMSLTGPISSEAVSFRLNGRPLGTGEFFRPEAAQRCTIQFSPSARLFKIGENLIQVTLKSDGNASASPVRLDQVELTVRYR